jgi:AraC-like DNA-binding protein
MVELLEQVIESPEKYVDLTELARAYGFSADHLNRVFQGFTGETAAQFVRRLLLERAARQLHDDAASVTDVSRAAGYAEPEAFTRAFRKAYGLPPSMFAGEEWRLPCASGIHGPSATFQPLIEGAKEFGLTFSKQSEIKVLAWLHVGDYREIPNVWAASRDRFRPSLVREAAWVTVFHSDGMKARHRSRMRAHLGFLDRGEAAPPGFESVVLPSGLYLASAALRGAAAHTRAWQFLNRNYVPSPRNRAEMPGLDLYDSFPDPWNEIQVRLMIALP